MATRLAADLVLVIHLAFIFFVIAGALLVIRLPNLVWVHVPAAVWGAWIEISGGICPLTTLENWLRRAAGEAGYAESFVEHYIVPIIYPAGLTRSMQFGLAAIVIAINAAIYTYLLLRWRKRRINGPRPPRAIDETDP